MFFIKHRCGFLNDKVYLVLVASLVCLYLYLYLFTNNTLHEQIGTNFSVCVDLRINGSPFFHTCHLSLFVEPTSGEVWGIATPQVSLPMTFSAGQYIIQEIKNATTEMIDNAVSTIEKGLRNPLDPKEFSISSNTTLVFDKETVLLYNCLPNFYHFLKGCLLPYYVALKETGRLKLSNYDPYIFMVSDYPPNTTLMARSLYTRWFPISHPFLYCMDYKSLDPSRFIFFPNAWIGSYSLDYGVQESRENIVGFRQWYMTKMGYPPRIDFEQKATKGYILLTNRKTKRFIVNFKEVKDALEPFGHLKEVFFEEIEMKEAMALVEKASIFIGIYGAGMMNLLWGRKGLDVIEFRGSKLIVDEMFLGFTRTIEMNHHLIYSKAVYLHNYTCSGTPEDCMSGKDVLPPACCYYYLLLSSVVVDVPHLVGLVSEILKRKNEEV